MVAALSRAAVGADLDHLVAPARMVELGAWVFKGAEINTPNTCRDCHGDAGEHGSRANAANLTKPSTWRSYKALGGDWNLMKPSLLFLIRNGGIKFNFNFKKEHPEIVYDWSKTGVERYDAQMLGLTQGVMQERLVGLQAKLKAEDNVDLPLDQAKEFGSLAVLEFVRSLKKE